ncbi:MAG: hypothetical protein KGL16_05880 [Acidobacteriota bacterium]|nr:hypothetical protein [Acidobacteriota bacterium]
MHPALELWSGFPVERRPRPIVVIGEGSVLAPEGGFTSSEAKIAYVDGRFVFTAAPPDLVRRRLHEAIPERPPRSGIEPLEIVGVESGSASFGTDRGPVVLSTWQLFFSSGAATPAHVLAVPEDQLYKPPPRTAPWRHMTAGLDDAGGRSLTVAFIGSPEDIMAYTASAEEAGHAVAVLITSQPVPGTEGLAVRAVGCRRQVRIKFEAPLGPRVLVDAASGAAVPVVVGVPARH